MGRGRGWCCCYYHWAEREKRALSVLRRDMAGFVVRCWSVLEGGAVQEGLGNLHHLGQFVRYSIGFVAEASNSYIGQVQHRGLCSSFPRFDTARYAPERKAGVSRARYQDDLVLTSARGVELRS